MKAMSRPGRFVVFLLAGLLSAATLAACVVAGVYLYFGPSLPHPNDAMHAELNEPLRVYTADHKLIGEFGAERRLPVTYDQIPHQMVDAFVAAEDDRFFQHPGVDYQGMIRAVIHLITTGHKSQGGSTITMQLARNLYLSRDKTYVRKIKEIILALRLESKLTKQQIFQLYANKIYLGERAYGVGAAARVYYQKPLAELTLAQTAMIAGLPKAPSAFNPIVNPTRAKERRGYVLGRMHALGMIDDARYQKALQAPVTAHERSGAGPDRYEARYVAEMVRQEMVDRYGDKAYSQGLDVITTIDSQRQRDADHALRTDLEAYDRRHSWHGPEKTLSAATMSDPEELRKALEDMVTRGGLVPAVVTAVKGQQIDVQTDRHGQVSLAAGQIPWLHGHEAASKLVSRGDVVRLAASGGSGDQKKTWTLAEIPKVQGALVAVNPHTGAIEALVGGFDFGLSKFNRVVQARRQPGSSFKPFLYSAALANGFTAATLVNDAPVVYDDPGLDKSWRPQNYSGKIFGPTRLREGLVHSRNLVSIRVLRSVGVQTVVNYASQFGLPADQMPHNLSLALGSATFSPLQMAGGYAVFANEGYRVDPYYIAEIRNAHGKVVFKAHPKVACASVAECPALNAVDDPPDKQHLAPRVIQADNAYIVGDMMRDVIRHGTGRAALKLGRTDLSGKTGTTNKQIDAWFVGFNANLVTISWVGFDKLKPMGHTETGAHAALPMWMDFMGRALAGKPEAPPPRPSDIVTVQIDPETGQRALDGAGIPEIFRPDNVPTVEQAEHSGKHAPGQEVQQLF